MAVSNVQGKLLGATSFACAQSRRSPSMSSASFWVPPPLRLPASYFSCPAAPSRPVGTFSCAKAHLLSQLFVSSTAELTGSTNFLYSCFQASKQAPSYCFFAFVFVSSASFLQPLSEALGPTSSAFACLLLQMVLPCKQGSRCNLKWLAGRHTLPGAICIQLQRASPSLWRTWLISASKQGPRRTCLSCCRNRFLENFGLRC